MRPWTTTHASHRGTASDYRTYLDEVEAIAGGAHGDPRGVQGYGSPLPPPLPPSGVDGRRVAAAGPGTLPPGRPAPCRPGRRPWTPTTTA